VVSGEQQRFEALLGEDGYNDDAKAEEYLTWNSENPASVYSSFAGARENARTTREVVSREMWETINTAWRWLNSPTALKEYRKDSERFHRRIRSTCAEFQGNCHDTMLHEEPFDFLRFGTLIERASQTARVMDVKHHWLLQNADSEYESPQESAQWMGLLRLCSAVEPFFKRHTSAPTGPMVMRFILQDAGFPRSVVHSLDRVCNSVSRINIQTKGGAPTATLRLAGAMAERLRETNVGALSAQALHVELTRVIDTTAQICTQASEDYFQPSLHAESAVGLSQKSSQQASV
jgi:uncharacterized alpha-E superfamily protein